MNAAADYQLFVSPVGTSTATSESERLVPGWDYQGRQRWPASDKRGRLGGNTSSRPQQRRAFGEHERHLSHLPFSAKLGGKHSSSWGRSSCPVSVFRRLKTGELILCAAKSSLRSGARI